MLVAKKSYDVFQEVIRRMVSDNRHTPDILKLEQTEFSLFFAYDDLQTGMAGHKYVEECVYLTDCFTQKYFQYFKSTTNPEMRPIALQTELTEPLVQYLPPPGRIHGQLLLIRTDQFGKLDKMMHNGVSYIRENVRLILPYREIRRFPTYDVTGRDLPRALLGKEDLHFLDNEQVYIIRAYMYRGLPEYWNDIIDAGYNFTSMQVYQPKHRPYIKRYYKFR